MANEKTCERCKKPVDEDSETLIFTSSGKFWCDERCLGVRTPAYLKPHPHFE